MGAPCRRACGEGCRAGPHIMVAQCFLSSLVESWLHWHLWDSQGSSHIRVKKDRLGLHRGWFMAEPEGESLEKTSDLTGGLVIDLHVPSGRAVGSKSTVFFVALTCLDPTFVTLSGLVVSSYQLSINRQNTHTLIQNTGKPIYLLINLGLASWQNAESLVFLS